MSHYFDRDPRADSNPRAIHVRVKDVSMELVSDSGVFSRNELDVGTAVLLDSAPDPPAGSDVLDLGCGYGPIALYFATRAPASTVWAVDNNRRALELTSANAERLGLSNVRARFPEDVPAGLQFSRIYSNPPIRIGKEALHALLLQWIGRLTPGGDAYLVVQKNLGADSLLRWMQAQGWDAGKLKSQRGYRILRVGGHHG